MPLLLLRRARDLLIVMLIVGTAMFFVIHLVPGSPALTILGDKATAEQVEAFNESLGLNGPLIEQYVRWLGSIAIGDFGTSISFREPVLDVLFSHIVPTLTLALISAVVSFFAAVIIVSWATVRPRSLSARFVSHLPSFTIAIPDFWLALILVLLFAVTVPLFPTNGYVPLLENPADAIWHLALPVTVLSVGQTSLYALTLRDGVLAEMPQAYLRTARSKGLSEFRVTVRHVLPNALMPCLTVLGNNFGLLLSGIVVIETIFVIPGLGSVVASSVTTRDYPLILGATMLIALIFVVVNLLVDLAYALLDPKLRVS